MSVIVEIDWAVIVKIREDPIIMLAKTLQSVREKVFVKKAATR